MIQSKLARGTDQTSLVRPAYELASKSIKFEEQSHLKVFEGTFEGSVDSALVEEVEAGEELRESSSRGLATSSTSECLDSR